MLKWAGIPLSEKNFSVGNIAISVMLTITVMMTSIPNLRYFITYINDVQKSTEAFFIVAAFNFHVAVYWYIFISQNTLTKLINEIDWLANNSKIRNWGFPPEVT